MSYYGLNENPALTLRDRATSFPVSTMRRRLPPRLLPLPAVHKFTCFGKTGKVTEEVRRASKQDNTGRKKICGGSQVVSRRERKKYRSPGDTELLRDDVDGSPRAKPLKKFGQYFPGRRGAFKCMYSYARVSL